MRGGLGGLVAVLLVALALGAVAACGGDEDAGSADPRADDRVLLEVTPTAAAPGASLTVRVVAPGGEPYEYGLAATLERRADDGAWEPTHHLSLGDGGGSGAHAPFGQPLPVLLIALSDDRPLAVALPPDLAAGTYRIAADASVGDPVATPDEFAQVVAHSADLTIGG